jgi:hypothetical protein
MYGSGPMSAQAMPHMFHRWLLDRLRPRLEQARSRSCLAALTGRPSNLHQVVATWLEVGPATRYPSRLSWATAYGGKTVCADLAARAASVARRSRAARAELMALIEPRELPSAHKGPAHSISIGFHDTRKRKP